MIDPTSYDEVNKTLNGIPNTLMTRYDPAKYEARKQALQGAMKPSVMDKIGPLLAGIIQGGTFGLGQKMEEGASNLWKTLGVNTAEPVLKRYEESNPTLSKIGELAGSVGTAFANPMNVGSAGRATVGALNEAIKGMGIGRPFLRGAAMGATQAIPTAAGEVAQGENVGQAAKNALVNTVVGGAIGSGAERIGQGVSELAKKIPAFADWLKKGATNTALRENLDIDPRSLRKTATFGGQTKANATVRERTGDIKEQLVDLVNEHPELSTELGREQYVAAERNKWKTLVDDAWNQSGAKVSDFAKQIQDNPTVKRFISSYGKDGKSVVASMIRKGDEMNTLGDVREDLQKVRSFYEQHPQTEMDADKAGVAKAIRDTIDDAFVPPELKADYAKFKVIDDSLTREEFKMPRPFSVGSQTAGRLIGESATGAALGAMTGEDPAKKLRNAGIGALAGPVVGSLGQRAGVALANKLTGKVASKIAPMIPEMSGAVLGKIGQGIQAIAPNLAAVTGREAVGGDTEQSVTEQEQAMAPEQQQAAAETTNTAWADQIQGRLREMYSTYMSGYEDLISEDDFVKAIGEMTNNFDPHLTAGAVFQDKAQREAYLRSYDTALKLQEVNLDQALSRQLVNPIQHPVMGAITGASPETQLETDKLKSILLQQATGFGDVPKAGIEKQISDDIDNIVRLRVSSQMKRQILKEHLANYGINMNQLEQYGLAPKNVMIA